jgi:toxin ParE1/3/4
MRGLDLRPAARADLLAIHDYIAGDNPRRALSFVRDIRRRCDALLEQPGLGRARGDLMPGLRILPMLRRVVVAYIPLRDRIEIVRIFYAGQDWEEILRTGPDE